MSGHSKWSTIKRQKAVNDNARGQVFSKLARAITIAVKTGGGPNPDSNYKLKIAIDAARSENMPKETIERAISKAEGGEVPDEVIYEGFGPDGVFIIIKAATDNRNRTAQEVKNIFEKNGSVMGQPGSVSFNFEIKGFLVVMAKGSFDEQSLALIDLGAEEINVLDTGIEVFVPPQNLFETRKKFEEAGYVVSASELVYKPKTKMVLDGTKKEKFFGLLKALKEHDDTQNVFHNYVETS